MDRRPTETAQRSTRCLLGGRDRVDSVARVSYDRARWLLGSPAEARRVAHGDGRRRWAVVIDLPLQVLVQNAALLLAVAVVFDALLLRVTFDRTRLQQAISGLVLGVIGVSLMLTPWQFAPGIFFDTRTVLLNIVGLFFGAIPTLAALAVMITWRVVQGGPAALTGIVGMLVAAGLGLLYRRVSAAAPARPRGSVLPRPLSLRSRHPRGHARPGDVADVPDRARRGGRSPRAVLDPVAHHLSRGDGAAGHPPGRPTPRSRD